MASPPITETNEIRRRGRQRLIGAIALVALLVVFVPMLLDSEPRKPRTQPALAIPSKAEAPPLPTPPKAGTTPVEPAKTAATPAKAEPAKAEPAKTEPAKAAPAATEPAKAAPAKSTPAAPKVASVDPKGAAATPKLEGFAVQVGAFRDEAKLAQARQKLTAAKIPHYTERLDAQSGPLTRLRAGPFATREAAESALAAVKLSALEGKVVSLP